MPVTVRATVTVTANPADANLVSHPDLVDSLKARLTETYPAGLEVRWAVDSVVTDLVEVEAEVDHWALLLNRLDTVVNFHEATTSDDEDPEDPDVIAATAVREAIDLLRTHALPPEHPLAQD